MLYIRTGKPGHGKTLNTIREIDIKALAEQRTVYFHNITGLQPEKLKAQWFSFDDPEKWFDLPNDSIVVIDESQRWFGGRDPRGRPPEHITRFETMRHNGFEVHLITQDPRYLDVHARRLCNGHIHYWRVFKSQQLIRYESEAVIDKVEVKSSFKDADKKSIRLDKSYFGVYSSTQGDHHFKTKLPTKFILAIVVLLVCAFMVYRVYGRYQEGSATAVESSKGVVQDIKSTVGSFISPPDSGASVVKSPASYLSDRLPRVADIPASAPIYDSLTVAQAYPRPVCMSTTSVELINSSRARMSVDIYNGELMGCRCNSQQGNLMKVSFAFCISVVQNGFFDPAKPDFATAQNGLEAGQTRAVGEPASPPLSAGTSFVPPGSSFTVVPDTSRLARSF